MTGGGTLTTAVYGSRSIRRPRRTKAEIGGLCATIYRMMADDNPMTVRQVFYRLVSLGAIPKTEGEYKSTVVRLLAKMRLAKVIPFGWISDSTRWMRKPTTYSSLEAALRRTAEAYRRSVWDNQDAYVEIWLEKEALAGVVYRETEQWDVPLMVTRGYPSLSYLYEAADVISEIDKPVHIYYFGDHDPSGVDIPRNVEARLREFAPDSEIHFEVVAVTPTQIDMWQLPTRPTKSTDTRSRSFTGESVEVDAIPPYQLRELVSWCIHRHLDRRVLRVLEDVEKEERRILEWLESDGISWAEKQLDEMDEFSQKVEGLLAEDLVKVAP